MTVECVVNYQDLIFNKLVEVGATYEVDDNRGKQLIKAGVVKEVVKPVEVVKTPKKKATKEAK